MSPQIWTDTEKAKMRESAEWHMSDIGYRLEWSVSIDSVGDDIQSWTKIDVPIPCGIEPTVSAEKLGPDRELTCAIADPSINKAVPNAAYFFAAIFTPHN